MLSCTCQMMAVSAAHDVPAETLEVVGGGVMEWRRHRDRHMHISGERLTGQQAGYVSVCSEAMMIPCVWCSCGTLRHVHVMTPWSSVLGASCEGSSREGCCTACCVGPPCSMLSSCLVWCLHTTISCAMLFSRRVCVSSQWSWWPFNSS